MFTKNFTEKECNKKILDCLIDMFEIHYPIKYNTIYNLNENNYLNSNELRNIINKNFPIEELLDYEYKQQLVHNYDEFQNNNFFYNILLDDFKMYMSNFMINVKTLLKYNIDKDEGIFDNNISFIYFYNFILFLKEISNKFPDIIYENIYKLDLILITVIFTKDYKITYENGTTDKYGKNYESYFILIQELFDLIKKKYNFENFNYDLNKFEIKFPNSWNNVLNQMEKKLLYFYFFYKYINDYYLNEDYFIKINENPTYYNQVVNIIKNIKNNNIEINNIVKPIKIIIENILKEKDLKSKFENLKQIKNLKEYENLNEIGIFQNIEILKEIYSLNNNKFNLLLISSINIVYKPEENYLKTFNPRSLLNFIDNREKILNDIKNGKNYLEIFKNILNDTKFQEDIEIILGSDIIINYYNNPEYFYNEIKENISVIDNINYINIYQNFYFEYIKNKKIYKQIIIKKLPYGLKGFVNIFLCFVINPSGIDMTNSIDDKKKVNFIKTFLKLLFIHETNHFSKRCYFYSKKLILCKTPKNYEGGLNIMKSIFGIEIFYIIDEEISNEINNNNNWKNNNLIELKNKFNLIAGKQNKVYNENELQNIKNNKNCLKVFLNYKNELKKKEKNFPNLFYNNNGIICY